MTWGEMIQFGKLQAKKKRAKTLKDYIEVDEQIDKTFFNDNRYRDV